MSAVGFVILAHEHLVRVAEVARFLSLHGPVVIHVDTRVSSAPVMDIGSRIEVISTRASAWGSFSLVDATLDATRHLLDRNDVGHVCLLSGSCLPVRPLEDLSVFLSDHRETDFIESVPAGQSDWVHGGLEIERFQYWYPVNWKTRRWLFDFLVKAQRRLSVCRRMPEGLMPHMGLQWWCLTSATLRSILDHSRLPEWRRYFAWTWIPDESFFQTLVHQTASGEVRSQSLTLQRFDAYGRPFAFHDDHGDLLKASGHFFARKIDPEADALYARHLRDQSAFGKAGSTQGEGIDETPFEEARDRALHGGRGLLSASKMSAGTAPSRVETVRSYAVIVSRDNDLMRAVRKAYLGSDIRFHGHLFGVFPTVFSDDFPERNGVGPGCLPTDPVQRDYRVAQYLAKVLWVGRDRPAAFLFHPADHRLIRGAIWSDPNARLILMGSEEDLVNTLSRPLRNRKGKQMRPPRDGAWYRAIDADAEDAVAQALELLASDWDDPTDWILPEDRSRAHA